jgi:hypothetical protein
MAKRTTQKKGLKTWQKVALVGGAGLGVYALVSSMNKQPEPETNYAPDPTQPQYSAPEVTPEIITPPATVEPTALEKSYKDINNYFAGLGLPITKYGDRIEMAITYNGLPRKVQFWNNGRFMFYWRNTPQENWNVSTKGNYTFGGKVLTITDGVKKGQIKNGQDVLMNIKNAM